MTAKPLFPALLVARVSSLAAVAGDGMRAWERGSVRRRGR